MHVAQRADVLTEGLAEPALGRDRDRAAGPVRLGERPSVGVDDDRAADPADAALGAGPVAYRDEHPVDGRVRLRLHDLGRPLAVRVRSRGPVDRCAQQLGTVQRRQPDPFGELEVIADHHRDPAEPGRYHGRGRVTGRKPEPLPVPQVRLAVDAAKRTVIHQRGAVVHLAGRALAEAADDDQFVLAGQPRPQGHRLAVGRLRPGAGLGAALEDITAGDQLGQHDHAGALRGGVRHGPGGQLAVGRRVTQHGGELAAGYDDGAHGIGLPVIAAAALPPRARPGRARHAATPRRS